MRHFQDDDYNPIWNIVLIGLFLLLVIGFVWNISLGVNIDKQTDTKCSIVEKNNK